MIVLKVDRTLRVGSHEAKQSVKHEDLVSMVLVFAASQAD